MDTTKQLAKPEPLDVQMEIKDIKDVKDKAKDSARGKRLCWTSEKLVPLLRLFEAVRDAVPNKEPTAFCFGPDGLQVVVRFHETDYRFHVLNLDKTYFHSYHCPQPFQVFLYVRSITDHLNKMEHIHKARCVKMEDDASGQFFLSSQHDGANATGTEKGIVPCNIRNVSFYQDLHRTRPINKVAPYLHYPFTIIMKTQWWHGVCKGLEKASELVVRFHGATRRLSVETTIDGAIAIEECTIAASHVLGNPFLPNSKTKSHVLVVDSTNPMKAVSLLGNRTTSMDGKSKDSKSKDPTSKDSKSKDVQGSKEFNLGTHVLDTFEFSGTFVPRDLCIAVKRPRVESYLRVYMCPGQPLVIQFLLSERENDPERQSYYASWNAPLVRDRVNPLINIDPQSLTTEAKDAMLDAAWQKQPGETQHQHISPLIVSEIDKLVKQDEMRKQHALRERLLQQEADIKASKPKKKIKNENETSTASSLGAEAGSTLAGSTSGSTTAVGILAAKSAPASSGAGVGVKRKRGRPPKVSVHC